MAAVLAGTIFPASTIGVVGKAAQIVSEAVGVGISEAVSSIDLDEVETK